MQQKRQEKHDNVYRESVSHVFPKFEKFQKLQFILRHRLFVHRNAYLMKKMGK